MIVTLRPWTKEHIDPLVLLLNNKKIWDNVRDIMPHPYTKRDAENWIVYNKNLEPVQNFAIEANGQLAGAIGMLMKDDIYRKTVEIGYWIGEPYWNKGIGTEAVGLLVEYIWMHFDLVRIYASAFETNKASMRVLEKNNFQLEAIHKKGIFKNNRLMDEYIWVKLRDDF